MENPTPDPEKILNRLQKLLDQLSFMNDPRLSRDYKLEKLHFMAENLHGTAHEIKKLGSILLDRNFAYAMSIYYEAKGKAENGDEQARIIYEKLKPSFHQSLCKFMTKQ
jgi:hypothetical protein